MLPTFNTKPLPYMGAKPYDREKISKLLDKAKKNNQTILCEHKMDGVYFSYNLFLGVASLRSGREVPVSCLGTLGVTLQSISQRCPRGHILGELMIKTEASWLRREETSGYLNSLMQGGDLIPGNVFHLFSWGLWTSPEDTIQDSKDYLTDVYDYDPCLHKVVTLDTSSLNDPLDEGLARKALQRWRQEAYVPNRDGFIYKLAEGTFKEGKPGYCLKFKPPKTAYLKVIGFKAHKKDTGLIGSFLMGTLDGLVEVYVGSGLTDELRESSRGSFLHSTWEVEYEDLTEENKKGVRSLTLPRLKGFTLKPVSSLKDILEDN
jgi:hypothetical protein